MKKSECFLLGHFSKTNGYKGALNLFLDVDDPYAYQDMEMLFVEINNHLVPFFIESLVLKKKKQALIKLEDVNSESESKALVKKEVFLPIAILPELDDQRFYFHEVIGFQVEDQEHGTIGKIQEIFDLPNNPLLQVMHHNQEILIPINDDTIEKIDRKKKKLLVKMPEGLMDLYTNE